MYKLETRNNKGNGNGIILINNYLKCKWIGCPNQRQRLAEKIQKQDPYIFCLQGTHLKTRDTYRLKIKGWKKIFHTNGDQKKARVARLYIYIYIHIHTHRSTAIWQILTSMKGEINNNTIIVGNFNTALTPVDRSTKKKINKETEALNDKMNQLDLIDIYRTFHPKTMNFTFFSSTHGTFSRVDHILGHKSSLGKFKKIEIIASIFSDRNAVRLDINYRKKPLKFPTYGG